MQLAVLQRTQRPGGQTRTAGSFSSNPGNGKIPYRRVDSAGLVAVRLMLTGPRERANGNRLTVRGGLLLAFLEARRTMCKARRLRALLGVGSRLFDFRCWLAI